MALLESLFRIIDASVLLPALFAILPLRYVSFRLFQPVKSTTAPNRRRR